MIACFTPKLENIVNSFPTQLRVLKCELSINFMIFSNNQLEASIIYSIDNLLLNFKEILIDEENIQY